MINEIRDNRLQRVAHGFIITALVVYFIYVAKALLIPIILAVVLWYIINALDQSIKKISIIKRYVPNWLGLTISSIIIMGVLVFVGNLVLSNVNGLIETAPEYRVNLEQQLTRIANALGFEYNIKLETISAEFNFGEYLKTLLNDFSAVAQRGLLVLLYTLFLLIEQNTFPRKIASLRFSKERKDKIGIILNSINVAVRKYIGVKFFASLATGVLSYLVILYTGLEFPLFWAFLIFVLNFIPTIGSIIATLFPSFVALIQFEELTPFFTIIFGVGLIQVMIGGIIEPRLYGNSLNISPFVIVISLVLWGMLWGIAGMLLCIPITVILIKIFAQFPSTRPIAVLLTQNGKV